MGLAEEILENWNTDIPGYAHIIPSLPESTFPAWTIRNPESYGVVLLYSGAEDINESFSNVRIVSKEIVFEGGSLKRALTLTTSAPEIKETFASLCAALVSPGDNGDNRKKIMASPLEWWRNWKEMLGNKNIDPRIYDVLGELCVLREMLRSGEDISWNGPDRLSYDIEMESRFVEVKSTISRNKRQVTISNLFQLKPQDKPLWLVLCQFEPTVFTGDSIDSVVEEIREIGYNINTINEKLSDMGFEQGMSSRKKTFILHNMLQYTVGDDFPRITDDSFVGGVRPPGIISISYTVDLSDMPAASIYKR